MAEQRPRPPQPAFSQHSSGKPRRIALSDHLFPRGLNNPSYNTHPPGSSSQSARHRPSAISPPAFLFRTALVVRATEGGGGEWDGAESRRAPPSPAESIPAPNRGTSFIPSSPLLSRGSFPIVNRIAYLWKVSRQAGLAATMAIKKLCCLLAAVSSVSAFISAPIARGQHPLSWTSPPPTSRSGFKCDLPPVLDPAEDGLPSAKELFSSKKALHRQIRRHQAIVRVPSICFDDLGSFEEDERWAPFYTLHHVLAETYPAV